MHKALFGLITVAAFVAFGVLIYNRTAERSAGQNSADRSPVSAVVNGECCSSSTDIATSKPSCSCCNKESVATSLKGGSVAVSEVGCCDKTVATSAAKKGSCCAGGEGECCSGTGACCAEDSTVSTEAESCCAGEEEAESTVAIAVTVAVAKPCGCLNECTCEKKAEVAGNQK